MNTAMSTTIEHILNLKVTLWGSPSCAATRRVCKVRGIANPSGNDFQWELNSILANLLLHNIYVDKFRMVFVKTADCTHVHNSVCMPELTVGCKWAVHLRKAIGCHGFDESPSEGGWIVDQVKTADSYYCKICFCPCGSLFAMVSSIYVIVNL